MNFQHNWPFDPTELIKFRHRLGDNITYATDPKLRKKIIEKCRAIAKEEGVVLRQSYKCTLKQMIIDQRFREHPKRLQKVTRFFFEVNVRSKLAGDHLQNPENVHLVPCHYLLRFLEANFD